MQSISIFTCEMNKIVYNSAILYYTPMAQVIRDDFTFTILDEIQLQYPQLVDLIL